MIKQDFTLQVYSEFLQHTKAAGYHFCTFENFLTGEPNEKTIILCHDVDKKHENSLKIAQLENKLGIKASYYFRIVKQINKPKMRTAPIDFEITPQ